jgi:RNA polymerase-binding transcription factor DksA
MSKQQPISTLDPQFLEEMKQKLLTEKERLEKELSGVATKDPTTPGGFSVKFPEYGNEEEDSVQEVAAYEANLSIEQDLEKLYRDILAALKRIEDGSYGICKYCQKPIDQKRLQARPTSGACVDCKKAITQEL